MRILHVLDTLDRHPGLLATTLGGMLTALRDAGVEADVAAGASHDDWSHTAQAAGEVAAVDEDRAEAALVELTHLAYRCDVVHVHAPQAEIGMLAVAASRAARKPMVVSTGGALVADSTERGRVSLWFENRRFTKKFGGAARTICVSEDEVTGMRQRGLEGSFIVLPVGYTPGAAEAARGASPDSRRGMAWGDERRLMAYFGDIDGRSGLVELIQMCTELGSELAGWRLVLAGRPVEHWLEHFQRLTAELALAVDFMVYPDAAQQAALRDAADLVVQPHLTPNTGVAALWAMAADRPVLLTDATPPASVLGNVAQVSPATPEGVRETLHSLTRRTSEELRGMGEKAGAGIRTAFDWSNIAPGYAECYDAVLRAG